MALSFDKLADIQYVPNAAGALYANPAATKTYVRGLVIFNGNTTTETVKLYCVPDASAALGTAGAANQFFEVGVVAKETVLVELPHAIVLSDENDSVQGTTTTANKVTIMILGAVDA